MWVYNSREKHGFPLDVGVICIFLGGGAHFLGAVPKKCTLGRYLRAVILCMTVVFNNIVCMLYISRKLRGLVLLAVAAFLGSSCNQVIVEDIPDGCAPLNLAVGVDSRAIIDGTSLSSVDAIGVTVVDATGSLYDSQAYNNVAFTATGSGATQAWSGEKDILLSGTEGTLYAYYPYTPGVELSAIPVDMTAADQTDWMYAHEADSDAGYSVSNTESTVRLTLNHALVNVRLNFLKGDYVAAGALKSVSVSSPAFATGGVLDAHTGTWTSTRNDGQALTVTTSGLTVGSAIKNVMLVPTGTESAVSITAVIDDRSYTVSSSSLTFKDGHSYNYNLTVNSTGMELTQVTVTPWVPGLDEDENLTPEK